MNKRWLILPLAALWLAAVACNYLTGAGRRVPTPVPTQAVIAAVTAAPSPTPLPAILDVTPVDTPTIVPTPTPFAPTPVVPTAAAPTATAASTPGLVEARMLFWEVGVFYDPAVWQPSGAGEIPLLLHRDISGCELYEQGPTEPPKPNRQVSLGEVEYSVAKLTGEAGERLEWYMATGDAAGPFPGGLPTWVIRGPTGQWETCQADAEHVLATLHR